MDKKIIKRFVDFVKKNEADTCDGTLIYEIYPDELIKFLSELLSDEEVEK